MSIPVVLKAGSKIPSLEEVPGDYEDWLLDGLGGREASGTVVDLTAGERLPEFEGLSGVLITGSGSMITEPEHWLDETADWLRAAVEQQLPVLGVCFGHQLLAYALGGEVGWNPNGLEVGTTTIRATEAAQGDLLFTHLPSEFPAHVSHRQSVLTLPNGAVRLAESARDPNQAFRFGDAAWGVQFHPEFDDAVVAHFVHHYRDVLAAEAQDYDAVLAGIEPAPAGPRVLANFAHIIAAHH